MLYSFWVEFIESYREQVCLWDVTSKDYSYKQKRNASYEMQKLKEINPQATIEILEKKISNMRTALRRELKNVQSSKRTGQGVILINQQIVTTD
nr:unnamed protein product [Callosobruchus analis]CAI5866035.1 unnamed protein product [Callosobruchus analis]